MTGIRILGVLLGAVILVFFFLRFRRGGMARLDFFLAFAFSGSLMAVSLFPSLVTVLRDMLALERAQFSRLIAIGIISNIMLWLVFLHGRVRNGSERLQFDKLVRHVAVEDFKRIYPDKFPLPPIIVLLPAFNEAEHICSVLRGVPAKIQDREATALVIDDGSDDGTADRVQEMGVPVIRCPVRRGGGAALRVGFDIARTGGAEIAVTMDADGQHLADEIEGLVAPILADRHAIVIGSRILGAREKDSAVRLAGIHIFNALIRVLTPVRITDCSNGFRAMKLEDLQKLNLRQDQYHTSELIIEASKKGLSIGEAPVTVMRRISGHSKKGGNWRYGLRFAWTIFKTWWR